MITSQEARELTDSINDLTKEFKSGRPSGSTALVQINAGAGVIGACVGVASLSLVAIFFIGGMWLSQSSRMEKLEQIQLMHDVRIRKNTEQIGVAN